MTGHNSSSKISLTLTVLLGFVLFQPVFSQEDAGYSDDTSRDTVRVRVFSLIRPNKIIMLAHSSTLHTEIILSKRRKITLRTKSQLLLSFGQNESLWVYSDNILIHKGAWQWISVKSPNHRPISLGCEIIPARPYQGSFQISKIQKRPGESAERVIINKVSFQDYLVSVVSAEMGVLAKSTESLKAQAIVSRSYAKHYLGRHSMSGADFCDSTHCQVYLGAKHQNNRVLQSVSESRNSYITHENNIIPAYYHSTCGGHTSSLAEAWGDYSKPYLVGVKDSDPAGKAYCRESPHYNWTAKIPKDSLSQLIWREGSQFGDLKDIGWSRSSTGRVKRVLFRRASATRSLSGEQFRIVVGRRLGWNLIKSTRFNTRNLGETLLFKGRGLGHGIGLCQYGAINMGNIGKSHREILEHYYPKTTISLRP
ncbi:MAG: SpoIID/LytB domain-containing protein [Spirochaetota bacterium]|nr:SpoIID/LytB domain-containing protein [Spirochaetota bacterium]